MWIEIKDGIAKLRHGLDILQKYRNIETLLIYKNGYYLGKISEGEIFDVKSCELQGKALKVDIL